MPLGPVMVDITGKSLTDHERERLMHPQVGGVILFSRGLEIGAGGGAAGSARAAEVWLRVRR